MSQKFTCTFNLNHFGLNAMSFVGELEKSVGELMHGIFK